MTLWTTPKNQPIIKVKPSESIQNKYKIQVTTLKLKKNKEQHMAILIETKLEHTAYYTEAKKWELED